MKPLPIVPPAEEPLGQRVASGLLKLSLALRQQSWAGASGRGLSPTQGQILTLLRARNGQRPSDLAEALALTPPTVSDSVRTLEEKGLLERTADPRDARAALLKLTRDGRREAERAAAWPSFLADAVDALEPQEQVVFLSGLIKVIRTLQGRGQVPVSRMCVTCTHFRPYASGDPQRPHLCTFVGEPYSEGGLRLDCSTHITADPAQQDEAWRRFVGGKPPPGGSATGT